MSLRPPPAARQRFTAGLVAAARHVPRARRPAPATTPDDDDDDCAAAPSAAPAGSNDEPGDTVVIGFSAPAADHGWMGAITESAPRRRPTKYDDIDLRVAEGTNDVNVADQPGRDVHQRRRRRHRAAAVRRRRDDTESPPGDGGRHPGHQRRPRVRRPERRPRRPSSATTTAWASRPAPYVCEQTSRATTGRRRRRDRRHRLAAADPGPQPGLRGRARSECGQNVDNRVAAEFTVESGEEAAGEPAPGRAADRLPLEPRRRPGCRRPRRDRERRPRRVLHDRRRRLEERDGGDPVR